MNPQNLTYRIFGKNLDKSLSRFWYPNIEHCENDPATVDLTTHNVNVITTPYKETVLSNPSIPSYSIPDYVRRIGNANIVLFDRERKQPNFRVANTDTLTFDTLVRTHADRLHVKGMPIPTNYVILGNGCTGRSAAFSCKVKGRPYKLLGRNEITPTMKFEDCVIVNTLPANAIDLSCKNGIIICLDQIPTSHTEGFVIHGIEFFVEQAAHQKGLIEWFFGMYPQTAK